MRITDQVFHPRVTYNAKDFDEQEGHRFTMLVSDEKPIETGVYLHWLKDTPVDVAVDISCMSGCSRKCIFCAAATTRPEPLDNEQLLRQVELAIERTRSSHNTFFKDAENNRKITLSFQGIGEPSDATAAPEVRRAIARLRDEYRDWKEVQISISSILNRIEPLKEWATLDLHTLQFSLHAPNDNKRRELLGEPTHTSITSIFKALDEFSKHSPATQVKINYLLISKMNDSEEDCKELLELLSGRPNFFLKISYLNETHPGRSRGLSASPKYMKFFSDCRGAHRNTYIYGGFQELQISCGQLASFTRPERANAHIRSDIARLYDDVRSGQCTLFLGAGAAYTAWDARGLAKKLHESLDGTVPFSEAHTLSEIADAFEYRGKRQEVDKWIRSVLAESQVPGAMFDMTRYPWRAIYTTNYDEFVERAYAKALSSGFSERDCHPVLGPEDLQGISSGAVPLIKLHGSVSQGLRTVLSETDYLDGYVESIQLFLHRLAVDRLEGNLLFVGYSFRDHFIKQWLFDLKRRLARPQGRLWAVQPERETTMDDSKRLHDQFGVTLIPTDFAGLMRELEVRRRRPVLMASGSKKTAVRGGSGAPREGATNEIERLCSIIAQGLGERGVRVVTGATATDKVGYLIGRKMLDQSLVTTYSWRGAEREPHNELSEMIRVREVGGRPAAVIDRLLQEANVLLVIGGGALTLRETLTAMSQGTPVIPVAIGGKFASDIIHNLFSGQHESVEVLSADIGTDARFSEKVIEILTPARLQALQLHKVTPDQIAATVFEILDHVATLGSEVFVSEPTISKNRVNI